MNKEEIHTLLASLFEKRMELIHVPNDTDWSSFENYFECKVPIVFKLFMEIVPLYHFEGGILNVVCKNDMADGDTIIAAYEAEKAIGGWPEKLIPFYDVGNGDYYCISKSDEDTAVYYIYHENREYSLVSNTIDEWIINLREHLGYD